MSTLPPYTAEDGSFKSTFQPNQVGYAFELLRWIYNHNNMTIDEKRKYLVQLEDMLEKDFKEQFGLNSTIERLSEKL